MKKLLIYMLRWQCSSPILALVSLALAGWFGVANPWVVAGVSNLIGSLIFFQVDKMIFKNK